MKIDVPSVHREKTKKRKNLATKVDTKLRSLKETVMDVGLGLVISTVLNYTILPLYWEGIANREVLVMLQISAIYTALALLRKYGMRRAFANKNWGL